MNNTTILIKVKERLNKLASNDYTNLQSWIIVEAFNKGQIQWCRRNLHGTNQKQEGADQSTSRLGDLQTLLTTSDKLVVTNKGIYSETSNTSWPTNYLREERIALMVTKECCSTPKRMKVWWAEEANVDIYLSDAYKKPRYDWGETFAIIAGDKIKIYHNNEFDVDDLRFIYYRQPRPIQIIGVVNLVTGVPSTVEVICEFSDDLTELLVDEAASILASDIESGFQVQRLKQEVENNN